MMMERQIRPESIDLGVNVPLEGNASLDVLAGYVDVSRDAMDVYDSFSLSIAL